MLRRALGIAGIVWLGSWFVIYREIYVWHHMTRTLRLNPPAVPAGFPPPQPGLFVLSARIVALAAPLVFTVLLIGWSATKARRTSIPEKR